MLADAVDEYKLCLEVIEVFGEEYLRNPTSEVVRRLLEENENGASRECWQLRLYALGMEKLPHSLGRAIHWKASRATIVLEAVALSDL
ncbi:hypothetical protein PsorP6_002380 [Peronosclerospora sorghi]|uniref:Uncharacterized protein n=1 Tax=Peronosclerospora sorghi TaxID=230839 RepID=A0ACC0WR85_9STRA|nr:hypothetical protein PsorP6_002380 [Peronosclerospora sorghi]